jgi:hypothetical protein
VRFHHEPEAQGGKADMKKTGPRGRGGQDSHERSGMDVAIFGTPAENAFSADGGREGKI